MLLLLLGEGDDGITLLKDADDGPVLVKGSDEVQTDVPAPANPTLELSLQSSSSILFQKKLHHHEHVNLSQ